MIQFVYRCLGFAQRFSAAAWNFGLFGAIRVLLLHRMSGADRFTHVTLSALRRPFWFRTKTDRPAFGMFCHANYRIADVYGPLCCTIIDAGANIGDSTMRLRRFHPQTKIYAILPHLEEHMRKLGRRRLDLPK